MIQGSHWYFHQWSWSKWKGETHLQWQLFKQTELQHYQNRKLGSCFGFLHVLTLLDCATLWSPNTPLQPLLAAHHNGEKHFVAQVASKPGRIPLYNLVPFWRAPGPRRQALLVARICSFNFPLPCYSMRTLWPYPFSLNRCQICHLWWCDLKTTKLGSTWAHFPPDVPRAPFTTLEFNAYVSERSLANIECTSAFPRSTNGYERY